MNQSSQKQGISISDFFRSIPFGNKLLLFILLTTYLLSFFGFTQLLLNSNQKDNNNQFHFWQIITSSFCVTTFFSAFTVILNLSSFFPKLETKTSSIWILVNWIEIGSTIQILYSVIIFFLPVSLRALFAQGNVNGIWFNLIFKYCYFNSKTKIKICCTSLKISKIVYPFIFLLFMTLMSWQIYLDSIIGIFLAFLECRFFKGRIISCSSDCLCKVFNKFPSWVSADDKTEPLSPYQGLQLQTPSMRSNYSSTDNQDHFSNKKGMRISDY